MFDLRVRPAPKVAPEKCQSWPDARAMRFGYAFDARYMIDRCALCCSSMHVGSADTIDARTMQLFDSAADARAMILQPLEVASNHRLRQRQQGTKDVSKCARCS